MKKKNSLRAMEILAVSGILIILQVSMVYAAAVYIVGYPADTRAYPYNTVPYKNPQGDFIGCGPATGAMILAYFEHHFGATGLLTNPVAGVDEGLATAWVLHSTTYMDTDTLAEELADPANHKNGFGSVYKIKPGFENYATSRGFTVDVVLHVSDTTPTNDPDWLMYGAYGDAWNNDANYYFQIPATGKWDINPNLFCDYITPKLTAGVAVMLTIDTNGDIYGDHWVPCVGVDKAAGTYLYYNTYDTSVHSATIDYVNDGSPASGSISYARTVEFIPTAGPQPPVASFTESAHSAPVGDLISFDASASTPAGSIVSYAWTFGDGATATGVTTSHAYAAVGVYTVTLTVTDNAGLKATATAQKTIGPQCVIPEVPLGPVMASISMMLAFALYATKPIWKKL